MLKPTLRLVSVLALATGSRGAHFFLRQRRAGRTIFHAGNFSRTGVAFILMFIVLMSAPPARSVLSQSSSSAPEVQTLLVGQVAERQLETGESAYFVLDLAEGEHLQIELQAPEINLSLNMGTDFDTNRARWAALGLAGQPIVLSITVPETQRYILCVNPTERKPKSTFRLATMRVPQPLPLAFLQRERAQTRQKEMLRHYYQKGKTRPAFEEMVAAGEEAAQLYAIVGMPMMQADTLSLVGEGWRQIGDYAKAIEVLERSLSISRHINFVAKQAEVYTFIGMCLYQSSDYHGALAALQQALPFWDRVPVTGAHVLNLRGWTWQQISNVHLALGDMQAAHAAVLQTAALYNQFHELSRDLAEWHLGIAFSQRAMGRLHAMLGQKQAAVDALTDAIEHYKGAKEDYYLPLLLNDLGEAYASLGEYGQALTLYEQALQLAKRMGNRAPEAQTLFLLGQLHVGIGAPNEAERYFEQALEIRRALNEQRGIGATLTSLADLQATRGAHRQALALYAEALQRQRAIGDRYNEAFALTGSGSSHAALHETAAAEAALQQALTIRRTIGDRAGEAQTLYQLARLAAAQTQLARAKELLEACLQRTEFIRASVLSQELRTSYLSTVGDYYEFYTELLMQLHEREPHSGYDAAALHAAEMARARSLLEMLAEAQLDLRADAPPALLERERDLRQRLSAKAEVQLRLQSGLTPTGAHSAGQLAAVAREVQLLNTEYQQVRALLRASSPRYAALTQPQPLGAAELQGLLEADTLLLEYALGAERSFVWVVTRTATKSFVLPARAVINAAAQRVYNLLTARNVFPADESPAQRRTRIAQADAEFPVAAQALSQLVLAPVQAELGQRRLLIVAHEALQFVPFAVLPEAAASVQRSARKPGGLAQPASAPLIVRHEIVNLPSASTLALLQSEGFSRSHGPSDQRKQVAVLADPVFSLADERLPASVRATLTAEARPEAPALRIWQRSLRALRDLNLTDIGPVRVERLPGTRREAERIAALVGQANELHALDFAANRALATSPTLSEFRIVHFATHALINTTHPALSGIVLSLVDEQGGARDGFLSANEIFNLKFSADLVVLSACQTGLGKAVRGEGLVGMVQSFLYAGASSVAVSLWSQQDRTTATLMEKFYQHLLGRGGVPKQRPAAALRAAQLEMLRSGRWPSPYFWAGFTVQGNYR